MSSIRLICHFRSLTLSVLVILFATGVVAQEPLEVVSVSPVSGTAGVSEQSMIVFTFNRSLDANTTNWNTAVVEPRGSIQILGAQLCVAFDPCGGDGSQTTQRFIRYIVEHEPDTDYTWLVYSALSTPPAQPLAEPFVLRYTTASSIGQHAVSGTVNEGAALAEMPTSVKARLAPLIAQAREGAFGPQEHETSRKEDGSDRIADTAHTRVLFLDSFDFDEPNWQVRAATVQVHGQSDYDVTHLRDGTYWPLVVRFSDAAGTEIEALGYLDDGSGQPGSVQVAGGSLQNVDLELHAFPLRSAAEAEAEARDAAEAVAQDAELLIIQAKFGQRPVGKAYSWTYTFRSIAMNELLIVETHPIATSLTTTGMTGGPYGSLTPISDIPIDSNEILDIVLQEHGGDEFIAGYPLRHIRTTIEAGQLFWHRPDNDPFWFVRLRTLTSSNVRTKTWFIDMSSGAPLSSEEIESTAGATVLPNHPNPFSSHTTIPVHLDEHAKVRVEVFDLMGRRVALLADGPLVPGEHTVDWRPSGVAPGIYLYRIAVNGAVHTGRMTLVR